MEVFILECLYTMQSLTYCLTILTEIAEIPNYGNIWGCTGSMTFIDTHSGIDEPSSNYISFVKMHESIFLQLCFKWQGRLGLFVFGISFKQWEKEILNVSLYKYARLGCFGRTTNLEERQRKQTEAGWAMSDCDTLNPLTAFTTDIQLVPLEPMAQTCYDLFGVFLEHLAWFLRNQFFFWKVRRVLRKPSPF